jgi:tRNA(Ile)-lysidine synthase
LKVDDIYIPTNTAIFVDENKLVFPLVLRRWKEGDSFQPLVWKASQVSFFKDTKLSLLEKKISGYCGQEIQLFGLLVLDKGSNLE